MGGRAGTSQSFNCVKETVHVRILLSEILMDFDRAFWETELNQQGFHFLSMVPLKQYKPILGSSAASAVGFQFRA